jgi:hypothetical protein
MLDRVGIGWGQRMSLGAGTVLATLVLVIAWQLDKRGAWRRAGQVLAGLIALLVCVGLGTWAYFAYQANQQNVRDEADAHVIRTGKLSTLGGIALNASREEVLYLWGQPTDETDGLLQWNTDNTSKAVFFDRNHRATLVGCGGDERWFALADCGQLAGLSIGASEQEVLERLGPPSLPAEYSGVEKRLRYGSVDDGFQIVLIAAGVTRFVVYRDRSQLRRDHPTLPAPAPTSNSAAATSPEPLAPAPEAELLRAADPAAAKPPPPVQVPASLIGEWNTTVNDCGTENNDSRLLIGNGPIAFYESHGRIVIVKDSGQGPITLVSRLEGEGVVFYRSSVFTLSPDANSLTDSSGLVRFRCPSAEYTDSAVPPAPVSGQ